MGQRQEKKHIWALVVYERMIRVLGSNIFRYITLVWFVLSALWVALTADTTVLHDEPYHYGLIKRYAQQWSPFISQQTIEEGVFGDIVRNTSYLYHYLLSFAYRIVAVFLDSDLYRLVSLRLLNVLIALTSLVVIRALIIRVTKSKSKANLVTFMVANTTIYVFIAGAVNYENLFVLFFVLSLYFAADIVQNKKYHLTSILSLIACLTLGSLTKYPFLTIAFGFILYLLIDLALAAYRNSDYRVRGLQRKRSVGRLARSWLAEVKLLSGNVEFKKGPFLLIVLIFSMIASILFAERYGMNIIKYQSFNPDCSAVQQKETCMNWVVYARNERLKDDVANGRRTAVQRSVIDYVDMYWFEGLRQRVFAMYTGWDAPKDTALIKLLSLTMIYGGGAGYIIVGSDIRKKYPIIGVMLVVSGVYLLGLLVTNYGHYNTYKAPIAIQGRYLMAILPVLYLLAMLVYSELTTRRYVARILIIPIVLLAFLSNGVVSYMQLTTDDWYMRRAKPIQAAHAAKRVLSPLRFLILDSNPNRFK